MSLKVLNKLSIYLSANAIRTNPDRGSTAITDVISFQFGPFATNLSNCPCVMVPLLLVLH